MDIKERKILEVMLHDIIKHKFIDRRHNNEYLLSGFDREVDGFRDESKDDISEKRMKYIKQTSDSELIGYLKKEFYPVLRSSDKFDRIDKIASEGNWNEPGY